MWIGKWETEKSWDERGAREEDCRDENDNNENETCIDIESMFWSQNELGLGLELG